MGVQNLESGGTEDHGRSTQYNNLRFRDFLRDFPKRTEFLNIMDPPIVFLGDDECVGGNDRHNVQEREEPIIFVDRVRRNGARDDLAENAVH